MIEVYKYLNGLYPHIISDIFKLNLRNFHISEKQKKTLDLQVFSRIGKTMKKLQWIA